MKRYFKNVWTFMSGAMRLGDLSYKPGWSKWTFFPVYVLNYGTHCILTGGAVMSWSRSFHEGRDQHRFWKFMDRLMNKFHENHGEWSSPSLWDTKPCRPEIRVVVTTAWTLLFIVLIWG